MNKKHSVGGQAVIEGVMMRGSEGIATAVRVEDGSITLDVKKREPLNKKYKILSLPIIRGFVSLIESTVVGIETLNYSASLFEEEDEDYKPSKFDEIFGKIFKEKSNDILIGISMCISLIFSVGIFFIVPTYLANIFKRAGVNSTIVLNIFEGIIRVAIFILYLYLIGKLSDIKRVFEYHGAEHKTVFCYENNKELTPENAAEFSRFHPRCGTNFLFLVMIVSILLFSLTGWQSLGMRILSRILLLPVVSGVTYELIKWMGNNESGLSKALAYPGLMLQKLTTREPDSSQLEVAIKALKAAEGIDSVES